MDVGWLKHVFSVEMKSKKHVKNISISDEAHDRVLFEGDLGELVNVVLVEGDVLEFIGANGVLRIGTSESELRRVLDNGHPGLTLSSEVGSYTSTNNRGEKCDV